MQKKSVVLALGAVLASAAVAFATVTFDPNTGTGFVGKGDVQLAFGWNNAALQRNAIGVTFTYNSESRYDVECEWTTVTGGPNSKVILHDITVPRHASVNASIAYDPRVRNQITGFNLNGFGAITTEGTVPEVGGSCPGNSQVGAIVTVVTLTSSSGGLYVNYGGNSVLLQ